MNRTASGDFRVHREAEGAAAIVRVTGFAGTYFRFTVRPAPNGGSIIDAQRLNSIAPGISNAETCF